MGLYERIIEERAKEEQRRGRPLGPYRGVDSVVLDRLTERASSKSPRYISDMLKLHYFVHHGLSSWATGM